MTNTKIMRYLESYKLLPGGAKLYLLTKAGQLFVTGGNKIQEINHHNPEFQDKLHLFINEGNEAFYLLGSPKTSHENPQNATVKLGLTDQHHHFTPHAHGSMHYVVSHGFSGCLLFDAATKKVVPVKLIPDSIIYIPPMVPHAFYNRTDQPLITLIANSGLGLDHEDYATTKVQATKRLQKVTGAKKDGLQDLVTALDELERVFALTKPHYDLKLNEKVALQLYKLAEHYSLT